MGKALAPRGWGLNWGWVREEFIHRLVAFVLSGALPKRETFLGPCLVVGKGLLWGSLPTTMLLPFHRGASTHTSPRQ